MAYVSYKSERLANSDIGAVREFERHCGKIYVVISKGNAIGAAIPVFVASIVVGSFNVHVTVPRTEDPIAMQIISLLAQRAMKEPDWDGEAVKLLQACFSVLDPIVLVDTIFESGKEKGWDECQTHIREAFETPYREAQKKP